MNFGGNLKFLKQLFRYQIPSQIKILDELELSRYQKHLRAETVEDLKLLMF